MTRLLALGARSGGERSCVRRPYWEKYVQKVLTGLRARERRIAVSFEATLIESDGCTIAINMLDVSGSGFRITCNAELVVGEEVHLHLPPSDPVRATICWTRGDEAGGIFLDPATVS